MVSLKTIGLKAVQIKLELAAPRILEENRLMVMGLLDYIKPLVVAQTPVGPGHFGYHLKDSYHIDVKSTGWHTIGTLKAPAQGYWREFGTLSNFHKTGAAGALRSYVAAIGGFGGGGERATMTAHKTLSGARRLISFYYGGLANWWRS